MTSSLLHSCIYHVACHWCCEWSLQTEPALWQMVFLFQGEKRFFVMEANPSTLSTCCRSVTCMGIRPPMIRQESSSDPLRKCLVMSAVITCSLSRGCYIRRTSSSMSIHTNPLCNLQI